MPTNGASPSSPTERGVVELVADVVEEQQPCQSTPAGLYPTRPTQAGRRCWTVMLGTWLSDATLTMRRANLLLLPDRHRHQSSHRRSRRRGGGGDE